MFGGLFGSKNEYENILPPIPEEGDIVETRDCFKNGVSYTMDFIADGRGGTKKLVKNTKLGPAEQLEFSRQADLDNKIYEIKKEEIN